MEEGGRGECSLYIEKEVLSAEIRHVHKQLEYHMQGQCGSQRCVR
jgi:hypothetical protein